MLTTVCAQNNQKQRYCCIEYRSKFISRMFNGNGLYGCYALAATIFTLGLIRDGL